MPNPPPPDADLCCPPTMPAPPPGVFEIGLVLGGSVSAGAFTAGALDFLLEALENWHAGDPKHQVRIPFVAGASGGAICAAILGLLTRKQVPHIASIADPAYANPAPTGNKLWDIWVNEVDIGPMLDTGDLAGGGKLGSLLNTRLLDNIIAEMAQFATAAGNFDRPYFPAPYRMAVTLTNMRGIPFRLDVPGIEGWSGAAYVAHDDFARFAIPNGADPAGKRPDEFWVDPGLTAQGADYVDYTTYATYAAASGAFPAGLLARAVQRPASHYLYRPYVQPRENTYAVDWPQPEWSYVLDPGSQQYGFSCVDGGVFNNDPVSLVHRALAGLVGENPRAPDAATRALFMIDPLAPKPAQIGPVGTDLVSVVAGLLGFVLGGARYLTADMALIGDPTVFSRFQLVPARPDLGRIGETALAGDFFQAFGGFTRRDFRRHDFLLGRINMQNYLRTALILRGDNKLFDGWNDDPDLIARFAVDANGLRTTTAGGRASYYLPVIPDTSYLGTGPIAVAPNTQMLPWPTGALDPATLRPAIGNRLDAVLNALQKQELPGFFNSILGALIEPDISGAAADKIVAAMRDELRTAKLL
jgi:hypothetical protein